MNKTAQKRITIEKIGKTKKLDLSGLKLTEIPREVAKMNWLSSLKINSNQIRELKRAHFVLYGVANRSIVYGPHLTFNL